MIATYGARMEQSAHTWEQLLALPKASLPQNAYETLAAEGEILRRVWLGDDMQVAKLRPYVTIYDQDSRGKPSGWLEHQARALLQNGRVIYLDNKGRESRVHMYHIINNWHNLSRYEALAPYHNSPVSTDTSLHRAASAAGILGSPKTPQVTMLKTGSRCGNPPQPLLSGGLLLEAPEARAGLSKLAAYFAAGLVHARPHSYDGGWALLACQL